MTQTVLILGAGGRFGRHAVKAFRANGWRVRVFLRPGREAPAGVEAVFGDLNGIPAAAEGVDVIVNALNSPYHHWQCELPRQTTVVIAAAQTADATVILPGNVYNYGSRLPERLTAGTPHVGDHKKGQLRIEMEAAYRAANIRTIVLRAGDFLDDEVAGNWFDSHLATKVHKGQITYPGPLDVAHAWAWLPDVARATAALAERRDEMPDFLDIGFPGYTLTGQNLISATAEAAGRSLTYKSFPWWALALIAPLSPLMREIRDMRYLWEMPHRIDGTDFAQWLPGFQPTPVSVALTAALSAYEVDAIIKAPSSVTPGPVAQS